MSEIATVAEMIEDGWEIITIDDQEYFIKKCGGSKMIAHNSRDGFTSQRAARTVIRTLGKPYKIHSFTDPKRGCWRITTLEY